MLTFLAKKEKKALPSVDVDGDGVPDHRDQCPGIPMLLSYPASIHNDSG